MNRMRVSLLCGMILLAFGAVAIGNTAVRVHVNIPFDFYAGTELMPQGQYIFEIGAMSPATASGSSVLIRDDSGTRASYFFTRPGTASFRAEAQLEFSRYGDKYFLTSVEGAGCRATMRRTKMESEMQAQGVERHTTTLVSGD